MFCMPIKRAKLLNCRQKQPRAHKKISGSVMYRLCKDIKSFCYTIKKDRRIFIFEGKGFGHHMGVCQWGVRTMVKQGFLCKEILDYYYPGAELMKLVVLQTERLITDRLPAPVGCTADKSWKSLYART